MSAVESNVIALTAPKRIALIGSAPSSVDLAPYGDPSWTVWGCSPGAAARAKRVDAWFEIHPLSDAQVFTADYIEWMARLGKPVYMTGESERIPTAQAYPREEMVQKYGPYFFTSSLSWMFAYAMEQNPQEIGLWGVDMSATEEYGYQRAGCHYFITLARARGIQVTVPPESDLLQPPMLYGFGTDSLMYRKLRARKSELEQRVADAATRYENARNEWNFLNGALDDLKYMMQTWVE
jgi:hypothetical protein